MSSEAERIFSGAKLTISPRPVARRRGYHWGNRMLESMVQSGFMIADQSTPRYLAKGLFGKRQRPHQLRQDFDPSQGLWYRCTIPRYIVQFDTKGLNNGTVPYWPLELYWTVLCERWCESTIRTGRRGLQSAQWAQVHHRVQWHSHNTAEVEDICSARLCWWSASQSFQ
jgi:hypothetical protein